MKLACDSTKLDLLPFFEKAGILRPISAYIEDYSPGWIIIDENMITELKNHVKEQGYPAYTEEINYINGHNYHIYRDNLKLEVPEKMGQGCTLSGTRVKVMHDVVRNAVAFETCNTLGDVLRITMYGLASDDAHSYTQVLFPTGSDLYDTPAYIVAVGYDGTRTKIYETAENIPLNLLKKKLTQAKNALNTTDADGAKVGYYKPTSIVALQELVDAVQAAIDNADTSVHSYQEWIQILDNELALLAADDMAKIPVYEGSYYTLSNKERTALGYATAGLKVSTTTAAAEDEAFHWTFVPTGTDKQYYIQHVSTGMYISVAPESARIKADATAISDAIAFNLIEVSDGKFAIQHSTNANVNITSDASKNVIGSKEVTNSNAQWTITLAVDNHSAAIKSQLDFLISMTSNTIAELVAVTEPELQFHADITVLDEQLPAYVIALQEAYDAAVKGLSEGCAFPADLYAALKAAYDKVKKSYRKALTLPEATNDAEVMCYYIQCLSNDGFAYCTEDGRYVGALRTGELADAADHNYWFYLRPGEDAGEYYIYNLKTGAAVGHKGYYIYANGAAEAESYTLTVSEESYGFIIGSDEGLWNVQTSSTAYLQFRPSSTVLWNLIPIGKFNPAGVEAVTPELPEVGVYYDLLGRPVTHPGSGVYIYNGRKVIVE